MNPSRLMSLPVEMIMLIMVAVMSESIADFIRFRSCCRRLHRIGSITDMVHALVPRNIVPRTLPVLCGPFVQIFLDKSNPDALYRLGMHTFFRQLPRQLNLGLAQLKEAAHRGHDVAKYAVAMILIFNWPSDEKVLDDAFNLLGSVVATRRAMNIRTVFIDVVRRLTNYRQGRPSHPPAPRRRCMHHNLNVVYRINEVRIYFPVQWCFRCYYDAEVISFRYINCWAAFSHQKPG